MQLLEQMIKKKLELSDEAFLNKNYLRSIWNFNMAYLLSISLLKYKDINLKKRSLLMSKVMLNPGKTDSKKFKKLFRFMEQDAILIHKAVEQLQAKEEEKGGEFGDLYRRFTIACYSYEYPSDT